MAWNGSGAPQQARQLPNVRAHRPRGRLLLVVGCLLLVVGCLLLVVGNRRPETGNASHPAATAAARLQHRPGRFSDSPRDAVRKAMPSDLSAAKPRKRRMKRPPEMFAHLEGEDRKLAEAIQAALEADDLKAVLPVAQSALKSKNAEVRQNAVEALGWFGAAALPELTGCMADPDEDVRQAAENQWELALQDVERPSDQFNIVAAAFATISGEDALTSLAGLLGNAAAELIDQEDDEELAAGNRGAVLQSLVDIIEGGRPENAAAAKEAYNDITGNEWMGIDEAERYLADPENYDPDEPAQPEGADDTDASNAEQPQATSVPSAEGEARPVVAEEHVRGEVGGHGYESSRTTDSSRRVSHRRPV